MSEENNAPQDAPEPDAPNTPDAPADESQDAQEEVISKDKAKALRSEAKNLRDRLKAAEDRLREIDDANLSEKQKLEKAASEAQERLTKREAGLRATLLRAEIGRIGGSLGMREPEAMAHLVDSSALEIDLESMTISGLEDEAKRLKRAYPNLFIQGGTDGGAGGGGRPVADDMNTLFRKALGART